MERLIQPDPSGGQVVITRFECAGRLHLFRLLWLHRRIKRDVRRRAHGFVGARTLIDWPARTLLSITVWRDLDSIYSMGNVDRHIQAAKRKTELGVTTSSGIFCYVGDWRRVMFGSGEPNPTPLRPTRTYDQRTEGER